MMTPVELAVPVLHIAGSGHTGTTLTDVFLDNHPSAVGVGELTNLVRAGYLEGRHCACGRPASACPFWSEVRTAWERRTSRLDLRSYALLQRKFERYATWPRVRLEQMLRSATFSRYADWTVGLYQAIREVSGKQWIVDSSKVPTRAAALALMPGVDIRVLHLVRDGRGVVFSVLKPKPLRSDIPAAARRRVPPPAWRTAVFWTVVNLQAAAVRRRLAPSRSLRVRYEDLMSDFPGTASRLGRVMEVDLSDLARRVAAGEELRIGHTIEGNRLRMLPAVRLRPDFEWRERLAPRDRKVVWFIAGWLHRAYGYREDGTVGPDAEPGLFSNGVLTEGGRGASA